MNKRVLGLVGSSKAHTNDANVGDSRAASVCYFRLPLPRSSNPISIIVFHFFLLEPKQTKGGNCKVTVINVSCTYLKFFVFYDTSSIEI